MNNFQDHRIKIIKTLPHLTSLFLDNQNTIYSTIFTTDIQNYLLSAFIVYKEHITYNNLLAMLSKFERVKIVSQKSEVSIKGDIISFWPIGYESPIKAEFFGENLESLYSYDALTGSKISNLNNLIFGNSNIEDKIEADSIKITIPTLVLSTQEAENKRVLEKIIFTGQIENLPKKNFEVIESDFSIPQLFFGKINLLTQEIQRLETAKYSIYIITRHKDVLPNELKKYSQKNQLNLENNFWKTHIDFSKLKNLSGGFISRELKIAVFTDRELFGTINLKTKKSDKAVSANINKLLRQLEDEINFGEYVVHEDYGIAKYSGLKQEILDNIPTDYLLLKYAEDDELYVPLTQIGKITKYIGPEGLEPKLTRLGKASWEIIKNKVKKSVGILAQELLEHYAKIEISKSLAVDRKDSANYKKFVESFKFKETDDQIKSIREILNDLTKEKPMNRLLVGDVGFGKTEIAMRACFKILEKKAQVAVLAPTTVLTAQHYVVFSERFKGFGFKVAYLSRFNTPSENRKIVEDLNKGKIDIVIGTHRLLSSDVKFKNLQMIVVDEEQRFGVKQKEKIRKLNYGVHVLSLSATPIPRTLSIALSTIQDISVITTPPRDRKSIFTQIIKDDWNVAVKAISTEVQRGGQVYFIHNDVQSIYSIKARLEFYLPEVKFTLCHGKMNSNTLDKVMTDFYSRKYDCLISTTIIENGLDLPNVNTIIINKAHKFGLSQLYQLRGRVGRSDRQAYCYLLYEGKSKIQNANEDLHSPEKGSLGSDYILDDKGNPVKVKKTNRLYLERLQTLVDNQELGAGFKIASRDLEIRGAGNLLGEQQSGHINSIGYALYIEILAQEVEKLRSQNQESLS